MEPLVLLTRNERVESIHRGLLCVMDGEKNMKYHLGNPETLIYIRSTAKPFQALPLALSGAMEKYDLTLRELAVACGSHSGQPFHCDTVRSMLAKLSLTEDDLDCGSSQPYNKHEQEILLTQGKRPSPLHNCCSGKHAAMLALCKYYDFPIKGYIERQHPVQQLIHETLASLLMVKKEAIPLGIDGCGVPSYVMTLRQLAFLYTRLTEVSEVNQYSKGIGLIRRAILTHPEMISGEGEFCTELISAAKGRVIGKIGGEGVYAIALPQRGLGIALKIADGNERAIYPAVVALLKELKILDDEMQDALREWAYPPLKNHRGTVIGYTIPVFDIPKEQGTELGQDFIWTRHHL